MIEKKEVNVAVQTDDVMALVVELIRVIKEKGDYTSLMDELIAAVSGIDEIPAEFKGDLKASIDTILLRATEIAFMFVPKKEEV